MTYAPTVLFIYNRPFHTRKTLEALAENILAKDSELFIFADGPKANATPEQLKKIDKTRKVAYEKSWCKNVTVIESETNKGLAASIISGVTEIVNKYGKIIVLEDDIVTGIHFLEYMNDALNNYENVKDVYHITAWRDPIKSKENNSCFFYPTMDCWSWATWKDRWQYFKKDTSYYLRVFTDKMINSFNIDGTDNGMWSQIKMNAEGKINTWAIFWYASIFLKNGLCLSPSKSLVKNIGFDNSGVHCGANPNEEITDSINWKITNFPTVIQINKKEFNKNKEYFRKIHKRRIPSILYLLKLLIPKSLKERIKNHLKNKSIKSILCSPYHLAKKVFRKIFIHEPKPLGTIFMLHLVENKDEQKLSPNENMKVTPVLLDAFLTRTEKMYDVIALESLPKYLETKHKKKFIIFTMDDGYKNNYTKALPIFKKHNAPFTIFLAANFPEQNAILWWYELEDLLLAHDSVTLTNGITYECKTKQEKEDAFLAIRLEILKLNQENILSELNNLFCNYKINWTSRCKELCLSWSDICELQKETLVTIAAHTAHHYNLKQLPTEIDVKNEIKAGLQILSTKAELKPTVFAYPFGSPNEVSKREIKTLSTMDFTLAVLAYGGNITKKNCKDLYALPRVMLTDDYIKEKLK